MSTAGGLVVKLTSARHELFEQNIYESFSEPVDDYSHSRNLPLICFVVGNGRKITHLSKGKKGNRAGTDLRRLHLIESVELSKPVLVKRVVSAAPKRFRKKLTEKLDGGGLLPPGTFQALIEVLTKLRPETQSTLARFSKGRQERIAKLSDPALVQLAEQKEAVLTALAISGIDKEEIRGWDFSEGEEPSSYLDGLEQVRLVEDQMVVNDLTNLPGYDEIKSSSFASVVFENDSSKLTVTLANRLQLEKLLGVDLIYFNETFSCFLMIQYKAMETESGEAIFRFPNDQLDEEINRMDEILSELAKCASSGSADDFRLSDNPFFLKVCSRLVFNPDDIGLVSGMYLPLDYWTQISSHPSMTGPRGGKRLSYKNVRRYFDNTAFVTLASGAWVGSNIAQSAMLKTAIRSTLESGRAVVLAVNSSKDDRHRK